MPVGTGTWITGTLTVLALILLLGKAARWLLRTSAATNLSAATLAAWRVGPDARVRAVRVLDRVYLLYERGRESTLLDELPAAEFNAADPATAARGAGLAALLPVIPRIAARRKVARG